jgi:hypothetical protein
MSWWPYGEMAEALADAVLADDVDEMRKIAAQVKTESALAMKFKLLEQEICAAVDACRWDECDEIIVKMRKLGDVASHEVVRYATIVAFERDWTVLDRIVERTNQDG